MNYLDLAAEEMARIDDNLKALGILPCFSEPRATSAIPDILGFIGMVLESGHAYQAGGAVYFSVGSFERFGQISHLPREEMLALAAERGGRPDDPNKRDPLDFVLWQPSLPDEPAWESLWGPGRPGWHIECSALALRELGTTIDLHGGGTDLIFPHHECEAAQSGGGHGRAVRAPLDAPGDGAHGRREDVEVARQPRVRQRPAEGMGADGGARRPALAPLPRRVGVGRRAHARRRRSPRTVAGARRRQGRPCEEVRAALDDDLDTPAALAAIDAAAAAGQGVSEAAALLGVS